MSIQKLGKGRYRSQVYRDGKNVSVGVILGADTERFGATPGASVFPSEAKARDARALARERLRTSLSRGPTVAEWAQWWTTDPLYRRPKESTNLHNAERVRRFVAEYGDVEIREVGDEIVAEWIRGARNLSTIPVLKAMFNDAASASAGRLVRVNPFTGVKIHKGKGRALEDPPPAETVRALVAAARRQAGPDLAAWLDVAAHTGLRPGELDALRWEAVDFEASRIRVVEQFNAKTRKFSLPKNGLARNAPLTLPAREALLSLAPHGPFCFTNLRGTHWSGPSRAYHWKAVRSAVGFTGSLYIATRHYAAHYMTNVLDLPAEDVAIALGHTDGGHLIRTLYGHRDKERALDRVTEAYAQQGKVVPLRIIEGEAQ